MSLSPNTVDSGPTLPPAALDTDEAGRYIGVAPKTLANWRGRGQGPRYVRAGARVVYRVADLDAWLVENLVGGGPR
ncbi:helix-turn-helix transcriptional regulator [Naumannella halotolerans]|uniref:Helix-turn-helix protein n=1 Tax=Naumannella halotolerans TaxID=993414 RepID=A0A4R7J7J2_9ACTN|nr:helix-turn-helix protein [Naumannella halotolerans]